jgi:autotransporter strand-loop-strand O-heptosyltransferase
MKILYLAPHLSTGGMPAFLLKTIETLKNDVDIHVVEYACHSLDYVVQRNAIKEIVPMTTLHEDKMELFKVIDQFNPDVIHIHEPSERLDRKMIAKLYDNNRTYRIVETCHDVSFNPDEEKLFHPDYYAFCTPYHVDTFGNMPSMYSVIEFPIDDKTMYDKLMAQEHFGFNTDKKHVINIGLWTPGKNQGEMLELAKQMPDVEFHFIGNQAMNFEHYWRPLMKNVPKNVNIWGERHDAKDFLMAADVFMFNSTWECNPLVVREAISYGKKIIARDLPQYKNMFTRYITNLDGKRIKNQLEDLLIDNTTYEVLANNTTANFRNKLMSLYRVVTEFDIMKNDVKDYKITQHFVGQPFIEITGTSDSNFTVEFYDGENDLFHRDVIKANHWVRLNKEYFVNWTTKVYKDDELVYTNVLDYTDKRVYIAFDSSSLGDNIAWMPYVEEFRKKHNCEMIVSTFKNFLFESKYPEIEFVEPGSVVPNLYGMYKLGWFYDFNKEPTLPNTIPLQMAATNILGLDYTEIRPEIIGKDESVVLMPYVTIATNSTAGCKFWTREGWQEVINYLHEEGYLVFNTSKESNPFNNCQPLVDTSLPRTMSAIYNSKFFIGLSSGLSWLAWALDKEVIMISNFTEEGHEFSCHRVTNTNVCHGCWNDPQYKFDKGDWDWCPVHKDTDRQFECHKEITPEMVIKEIKKLLN